MTPKTRTLLLILGFVALTFGSFIWFIIRWDATKAQPVVEQIIPTPDQRHFYVGKGVA